MSQAEAGFLAVAFILTLLGLSFAQSVADFIGADLGVTAQALLMTLLVLIGLVAGCRILAGEWIPSDKLWAWIFSFAGLAWWFWLPVLDNMAAVASGAPRKRALLDYVLTRKGPVDPIFGHVRPAFDSVPFYTAWWFQYGVGVALLGTALYFWMRDDNRW